MINKDSLRQTILHQLSNKLETVTNAADSAKETATSDETVAENKYDTFGLEASYLAHGQSVRAANILKAIECYRSLPFKNFSEKDAIQQTALVALETSTQNIVYYLIGPEAGGLEFRFEEKKIMIITPQTPMGQQIIGARVDDTITLVIGNRHCDFNIVDVQ